MYTTTSETPKLSWLMLTSFGLKTKESRFALGSQPIQKQVTSFQVVADAVRLGGRVQVWASVVVFA